VATKKKTKIDLRSALTYPFQDKEWAKKFLIAFVLMLTIIMAPAVSGWSLGIARDVIAGKRAKLPKWEQISHYWSQGFSLGITNLIWVFFPLYLFCCLLVYVFILASAELPSINPLVAGYSVVITALLTTPAQVSHILAVGFYLETGSITESIQFRLGWRSIRANWKQFLGVSLVSSFISNGLSIGGYALWGQLGSWAGVIILGGVINIFVMHLYGQVFRNAKLRMGA
jgi:hypothetical protein